MRSKSIACSPCIAADFEVVFSDNLKRRLPRRQLAILLEYLVGGRLRCLYAEIEAIYGGAGLPPACR